jgi:hypothetical protein
MLKMQRPLRIFLCHSSEDKPIVRELYRSLSTESWLDVWLDEENLYPGQDWDTEIEKAVETTDIVIVCLSNNSVNKDGYIQRELRFVLRIADYKPEGEIFVIPIRLSNCLVPRSLKQWHYIDFFPKSQNNWARQRLLKSLQIQARKLGLLPPTSGNFSESSASQYDNLKYSLADLSPTELSIIYAMLVRQKKAVPVQKKKLLREITKVLETDEDALKIIHKVAEAFNMKKVLESISKKQR